MFFTASASAQAPKAKIPRPLIELWRRCTEDSDCVASSWGSCAVISINSKFEKEMFDTYKLEFPPGRELPPPDTECVSQLRSAYTGTARPVCEDRKCIFRRTKKLRSSGYGVLRSEDFRLDYIKPPKPESDEEDEEDVFDDRSSDDETSAENGFSFDDGREPETE